MRSSLGHGLDLFVVFCAVSSRGVVQDAVVLGSFSGSLAAEISKGAVDFEFPLPLRNTCVWRVYCRLIWDDSEAVGVDDTSRLIGFQCHISCFLSLPLTLTRLMSCIVSC